jgi:transposase
MSRKKYSKELKAQIALDAIKSQKMITKSASEHGVYANQISTWKRQPGLDIASNPILNCNFSFKPRTKWFQTLSAATSNDGKALYKLYSCMIGNHS